MNAVANATPLIALSMVGELDLLSKLFDEVWVPPSVYSEVAGQGRGRPGTGELQTADWIRVKAPEAVPTIEPLLLGLDLGELDVILLARELRADWVLIDERLARRVGMALGLRVKGTLGLLLAGVDARLLNASRAQGLLRELVAGGIRIGPPIIRWFEEELSKTGSVG